MNVQSSELPTPLTAEELEFLSPSGYYIALRLGFAFPLEEVNALPSAWVDLYTANRFMLHDPVIRWVYEFTGVIRWSGIKIPDPLGVMNKAYSFGLRFGVAVCCVDDGPDGQRSFGSFARSDREFEDTEIAKLSAHVAALHVLKAPPSNLTDAEIEALRMVKDGKRLKQIAHELGVTEGAVKQRLKNARLKLGAQTGPQAVTLASTFGLI